jgi:hypothetical protein
MDVVALLGARDVLALESYRLPGCLKHVQPMDQSIQRIEPKPRLPFRFQVQLLSQREEFLAQASTIDREGLW